jgi:hypothetical protein
MRVTRPIPAILGLLFLSACCGCGTAQGTSATLVAVKGKVTFKGQPLTRGVVRFEPTDYGRAASGKLQPDGTYVLTTITEADGVVAGHHRVSITDVDKKVAGDRAFKKFVNSPGAPLEREVSSDKTEFNFDIP